MTAVASRNRCVREGLDSLLSDRLGTAINRF